MFTSTTRPRGDDNLPARLGRTDGTVSLLGRRITDLKKAKTAADGTGGVIGIAEVESVAATVLHEANGLDRFSIRYDDPFDFGTPDVMRAGEFCTVNLNEVHLSPGSYTISVRIDYGWAAGVSGAPSGVQVAVSNRGASSDAPTGGWDMFLPTVIRSADAGNAGVKGVSQWTPAWPTIVSEGDWFWVELTCFQPSPVGTPVTGVNGDPGLHWTIWKWT